MESLLLRHVTCGRIVMALPSVVVEQRPERLVTWIDAGTPIAYPLGRADSGRLLPFEEWTVDRRAWVSPGRLELATFGRSHSIRLIRSDDGNFLGWYVNLQSPLVESRFGFDTSDWQLDLWIEPDGEAHWKDEDDLEQAVELGILTSQDAAAAREEAHRVLEEWPFPTGWEDWRPARNCPSPSLPEGWDVV